MDLSLIVPCYNSEPYLKKELPIIIAFLSNHVKSFELILIDDGSSVKKSAAALAKQYGCRYDALSSNKGKGAALRRGFELATGRVRIFTDSDFPFEAQEILKISDIILSDKADVVIGDRTNPASEYYLKVNLLRKIGSNLIAGIGKKLLKNHIIDTQCGIKGFSPAAANKLFPQTITNRFGIDFELLFLAGRLGMKIEKIPVRLRTNYPSSVNVVSDGLKIIYEIYQAVRHHGSNKKKG